MPEVAVISPANDVGMLRRWPMGCRSIGPHACNSMNRLN